MSIAVNRKPEGVDTPDFETPARRSGRVVWDSRGNSMWEWQTQPGVFSREVDTAQLKALLADELTILDDVAPSRGPWRR